MNYTKNLEIELCNRAISRKRGTLVVRRERISVEACRRLVWLIFRIIERKEENGREEKWKTVNRTEKNGKGILD